MSASAQALPDLNVDQIKALAEIMAAWKPGERYLLTGFAGSGKTTLLQRFAKDVRAKGKTIVLTAPTHKAVSVLARKTEAAKIADVPCVTIHSLLSLKPKPYGDQLVFERDKFADPVTTEIVVIDECSMVSADLLRHIKRHLPMAFVLFVGDPAQLPPVGEAASETFLTEAQSHLDTIVRQGAGNPVLDAAHTIRRSQGGALDWSWCRSATAHPLGVYTPREPDAWLHKAFTSKQFEDDPDAFRYLAWTNRRVADVNAKVRQWRYGDNIPTPFVPGEMAMFRAPIVKDNTILFNTNEEAKVLTISTGVYQHEFKECQNAESWTAEIPTWQIEVEGGGAKTKVHLPSDARILNRVIDRVKDEAVEARFRWKHLHEFQGALAKMQSIYALTAHNSQGSTYGVAFMDLPDIRRNQNTLEMQQMCYVAATRPSKALVLVGI